jgi:hypothetical protein
MADPKSGAEKRGPEGGWRRVRRSKSRRWQYRGRHGGGSRAPHNHKPELLLQLLIIALDPPSQLCDSKKRSKAISSGKVANQYLVGSASPCGHSISIHSSVRGSVSKVSRCAGLTLPRKARREPVCGALAPHDGLPRFCRQAESERLDRDRLMLLVASKLLGRSPDTRTRRRWQRLRATVPVVWTASGGGIS